MRPASSRSRLTIRSSTPTGTGRMYLTVSSAVTYIGCARPKTVAAHPIDSSRSAASTPPCATFLYPFVWRGRTTSAFTASPSTKNRARTPQAFSSPQQKQPDECGRYSRPVPFILPPSRSPVPERPLAGVPRQERGGHVARHVARAPLPQRIEEDLGGGRSEKPHHGHLGSEVLEKRDARRQVLLVGRDRDLS